MSRLRTAAARAATAAAMLAAWPMGATAQASAAATDSVRADSALAMQAKRTREVTHTAMLSVGATDVLDTYLGAERFTGTDVRYISHSLRQRPGSRVSRQVAHHVLASWGDTRGNGGTLLTAMYNLIYGWHYRLDFAPHRLSLRVGAVADATIGAMYDTSNSNNPAQARLSLSIDPSAILSWTFGNDKHPFTLQYEVAAPLMGLAFSPAYGQSYYEIFSLGDYDHNVVFTSPFNAPQLHQMLTLDFAVGRSTLRVGYMGDIRQMRANDLKYHQYTHSVVVGWVRHFTISPTPRHR